MPNLGCALAIPTRSVSESPQTPPARRQSLVSCRTQPTQRSEDSSIRQIPMHGLGGNMAIAPGNSRENHSSPVGSGFLHGRIGYFLVLHQISPVIKSADGTSPVSATRHLPGNPSASPVCQG